MFEIFKSCLMCNLYPLSVINVALWYDPGWPWRNNNKITGMNCPPRPGCCYAGSPGRELRAAVLSITPTLHCWHFVLTGSQLSTNLQISQIFLPIFRSEEYYGMMKRIINILVVSDKWCRWEMCEWWTLNIVTTEQTILTVTYKIYRKC